MVLFISCIPMHDNINSNNEYNGNNIDVLIKKLEHSQKQESKLKSSLKLEKLAQAGQLKKIRALQHEVSELKYQFGVENRLRKEIENKFQRINDILLRERAQRLQDLNRSREYEKQAIEAKAERKLVKDSLKEEIEKVKLLSVKSKRLQLKVDAAEGIIEKMRMKQFIKVKLGKS